MQAQCLGMMTSTELASVPSNRLAPFTNQLQLAVAAYLARFKGSSREHTESDLRCYLAWCAERGPDPLAARRPHLELYIRWMQEVRRFKPSTISRRFSVTAGSKGGTVAGRFSMAKDNWGGVFSAEVSSVLRSANRESSSAFMAFAAVVPAS
jgi:hypothetical protein